MRRFSRKLRAVCRRFSAPVGLSLLALAGSISLSGCSWMWTDRQSGMLSLSMGLAHPQAEVSPLEDKARKRLANLESTGKLDPSLISQREDGSVQTSSRTRAAATLNVGPGATTPAVPGLPDADASALPAAFSALPSATTGNGNIALTAFDLIHNTRDIYETLIPATIRFEMETLRQSYDFYYVPITLNVLPGPQTEEGYLAEFRLQFDRRATADAKAIAAARNATEAAYNELDDPARLDILDEIDRTLKKGIGASPGDAKTEAAEAAIKKLGPVLTAKRASVVSGNQSAGILSILNADEKGTSDATSDAVRASVQEATVQAGEAEEVRILTVLPLRQYDLRLEAFGLREQEKFALQLQLSGPLSESAAGALNSAYDRIRRLENNFITLAHAPTMVGGLAGDNECVWRVFPSKQISRDGDEVGEIMRPGPRDAMVVLSVKRKASIRTVARPELRVPAKITTRWVELSKWSPALGTENRQATSFLAKAAACGECNKEAKQVVLPMEPLEHPLSASLENYDPKSSTTLGLDSTMSIRIRGSGFTSNTRVVLGAITFAPAVVTPDRIVCYVDGATLSGIKGPDKDKLTRIPVSVISPQTKPVLLKEELRLHITKPNRTKATLELLGDAPREVRTGQLLRLKFVQSDGKSKNLALTTPAPNGTAFVKSATFAGIVVPATNLLPLPEGHLGVVIPALPRPEEGPYTLAVDIDGVAYPLDVPLYYRATVDLAPRLQVDVKKDG